ncbi:hypothetical protein ACLIBH_05300 [Virgibacillus sp. W0430]|uniref:hypothetical protein n=1 Tax=Virgibacillus sp. W0430 TaxID=3391580 RepID=UPI003F4619AD
MINQSNEMDVFMLYDDFEQKKLMVHMNDLYVVWQLIHKQGGKIASNVQNNEFSMDVSFR